MFFDRELSLKAKGIYCQIRSLEGNPEWVFTIRGFASLVKDGVDSVSAGIKEVRGRRATSTCPQARGGGQVPQGRGGHLDHARRPRDARRRGRGAARGGVSRSSPSLVRKDRATKARDSWRKAAAPRKPRLSPERENPYLVRPHPENPDLENAALCATYSWDKTPESNQQPLSSSPREAGGRGRRRLRALQERRVPRGVREALCDVDRARRLPRFKRSCLAVWEKRGRQGIPAGPDRGRLRRIRRELPRSQRRRRPAREEPGEVARGDDGLPVWSDEPYPRTPWVATGSPCDMEGLAKADPGFAKLWRRVAARRRSVILRCFYDRKPGASREEFEGGMRGGRGARDAHGGVRGALRALPRPVRLDGGRRSRGKEGCVVRIVVRFARWLFRAVFRFM